MGQKFVRGETVRWGILGCGDVTEIKSGPGFQKANGAQLVAVMRRNGALAQDYARRHGVGRWYDDAEALINDPEVDAIYIATPPGSHLSCALQVAAAGKPAYVEKPMARMAAECDAMVDAFQRRGLPLFVAYYRRCLPRFEQARALIQSGAIGTVTSVSCEYATPAHRKEAGWRTDVASAGAGLFLDLGSHALDLIDHMLGPLTHVHGLAANLATEQDVEDTVAMSFLAGQVPGRAAWNFASATALDRCEFLGTHGRVSFAVFENEPVRWENADGVQSLVVDHPAHVQQPLIQSVTDDLLGRGTCPSTGESARRTSRVMDLVLSDYYGGRGDEFWKRVETWPGLRDRAAR
jgi:predicted dehydrogenase